MRDIKFKVWDKSRAKFVCCYQGALNFTLDTGQVYNNGFNCTSNLELMQFTGLTDKNSVEIYEGDIVKCPHGWLGIVRYYSSVAHFACEEIITRRVNSHGPIFDEWEDLEVIGNIYETPELLNK